MSASAERELARLRARFEARAHELAQGGFILRGTILERFSRCGTPGCGCHDEPPRLHGPYRQWTRKVKGKTVTRNLSEAQARRAQEWIDNGKRFDQIVEELQQLSAQADAILRAQERPSPEQKESAPKKRVPRRRARSQP